MLNKNSPSTSLWSLKPAYGLKIKAHLCWSAAHCQTESSLLGSVTQKDWCTWGQCLSGAGGQWTSGKLLTQVCLREKYHGWIGKMLTQILRLRTIRPFISKKITQLNCLSNERRGKKKKEVKKQLSIQPSGHRRGTIILEELSWCKAKSLESTLFTHHPHHYTIRAALGLFLPSQKRTSQERVRQAPKGWTASPPPLIFNKSKVGLSTVFRRLPWVLCSASNIPSHAFLQ